MLRVSVLCGGGYQDDEVLRVFWERGAPADRAENLIAHAVVADPDAVRSLSLPVRPPKGKVPSQT
jgi:hypothetical protein